MTDKLQATEINMKAATRTPMKLGSTQCHGEENRGVVAQTTEMDQINLLRRRHHDASVDSKQDMLMCGAIEQSRGRLDAKRVCMWDTSGSRHLRNFMEHGFQQNQKQR